MAETKRTQAEVASLNTPGVYGFGRNLKLQVAGPTAKSWIFRYTVGGKTRDKGIGSARNVTLAQARKLTDDLRVNQTSRGIDPVAEEKREAEQRRLAQAKSAPFRQRVEEYLADHDSTWRNAKHRAQWRSTLESYAYPVIADLPAHAITVSHLVEILRPIWAAKFDTARKVRGRIESVLDYAADPDDATYRNPAARTAQLLKKLPKLPRGERNHHPALPYDEIAGFMTALRGRDGMAARALEFTILTAARTGEVLGARWTELDTENSWTIPASRTKGNRPHRVPLSGAARAVLERVKSDSNGEIIFPSLPHDRSLSNMALLNVLKRMDRAEVTTHGFRSTFRTWAGETTAFPREVAEAALAHVLKGETEKAYMRGDLFEKRRLLMEAWATHCEHRDDANVVSLTRATGV